MRLLLQVVLGLALARPAVAQTTVVGDAFISGTLSVGTSTVSARLQVQASSTAGTAFQVSGVDETPFLTVSTGGPVGLGVSPDANLDVMGSGDNGTSALELRNGNLYPANSAYQMTFGVSGTSNLRHAIRTVHSTTTANSSIDFLLWTNAVSTTSVGALEALSLLTTTTTGASFHVMPVSVSTVQVVVSNGQSFAAGTVIRTVEGVESSRAIKSDIAYLGLENEERAYGEAQNLKHATFRYKVWRKGKLVRDRKGPLRHGLIYEDVPDDLRGPDNSVVIDERVNNAELAMKALLRRLEGAEAEAAALGPGKKP